MQNYLKKVLRITGAQKKKLPWMLILYFVAMALELVGISLIIPFIAILQDPGSLNQYAAWGTFANLFSIENNTQAIVALSALIFTVYLIKTLLNIQTQRSILNFSYGLQVYLREKFSGFYLAAPYLFHTRRRSNEIINILQSHISQFSRGVVGSLLRIAGEGITLLAISVFLLITYPIPAFTALALLSLFGFFYDIVVRRRLQKAGQELISANNDLIKSVRQGVHSLKEARVLGCTDYFHGEIADSARRASNVNAYVAVIQMVPRYILELLMVTVVIAASLSMLTFGDSGREVIDSLAIFAVAAIRLLPASNQIISNIANLRYSDKAVHELYDDLEELEHKSYIREPANQSQKPEAFQSLALNNVSFAYPNTDHAVFDNISFEIKKGEILGVVGPSGAGKSTLVDIVLGLINPDEGQIQLNNQEISAEDWASQELAAYIPQNPVMLDDTVTHNIALGQSQDGINQDVVQNSLTKAQMANVVENLPLKEATPIGEDAVFLSGGQRQRIALARTFYFNREIIIFDEATSALDKETEQDILESIKHLKEDAAVLIISHNEQPLQICDRVLYLSKGKIIKEEKQ